MARKATTAVEQLAVMNNIAAHASHAGSLEQLLELALADVLRLTGMGGGSILLLDEEAQELRLAAYENMPDEVREHLLREPVKMGQFIPGIAAEHCELLVVRDSQDDEREMPLLREFESMTHVCIPLAVGGKALGVLGMIDAKNRHFSRSELNLFTAVGEQLGIAIERARVLEQQADIARLQERYRLARDIHDTVAQLLIGVVMELELSERLLRADIPAARRELAEALTMARAALEETRRSVLEMRSSALEASSLAESVARELRSLERAGIATRAIVTGEPGHLTSEMETALLRIMQEAVANTRKHAAASRVEASLEYGTESVTLSIVDDGNGFEPEAASRSPGNTGFGLIGMSERAALLGGKLELVSSPGKGTRVCVSLPYRDSQASSGFFGATEADQAEAQKIRVLIADDHAMARQGVKAMLEDVPGIEVVGEAADASEALERTRELQPDIVLTDLQMPGRSGIELISDLRQEGLASRAILLSAFAEGDLIIQAMRAGAAGYLLKDSGANDLANAIRSVHSGKTVLQPGRVTELATKRDGDSRPTLTAREQDVLLLLGRGLRNKEIARELAVSQSSVRFHVTHIFEKLNVSSRTEAVTVALQHGLISSSPLP